MSRIRTAQTNFTAGEIAPPLAGRGDLRAYANGAARLSNVLVLPTGGLTRRPGFRFVDTLPETARLAEFEFNTEQTYLVAFLDGEVRVYRDEAVEASLSTPWGAAQLEQLSWTQNADTLLVCHPDTAPRRLVRTGPAAWTLDLWPFVDISGRRQMPHYRFVDRGVVLNSNATSGSVTLVTTEPVFDAGHIGSRFRLSNGEIRVDAVINDKKATGVVTNSLANSVATAEWTEEAWSDARGWPVSATFHQDRLVVGGSRDLPNRLWMSKTGAIFNFDLGTGLDDQAIEFPILSDQVNAIRSVFSGRHLQVFTSGAEWMVTGDPLTPETVQLRRQTRIGSPVDRRVPPRDVEGATVFVARNGKQIREFLFADTEQAYRAADLALLAEHLIDDPVDQDYDPRRRLLLVANRDGRVAALTAYRSEQVTAWSRIETDGAIESVAVVGGTVYAAIARAGGRMLEALDDGLPLDSALTGSADPPKADWSGLDHLDGRQVRVVADGVDRGAHTVVGGAVTLDAPAAEVAVGLPFAHVVEPLPPILPDATGLVQGLALRPVESIFRLDATPALSLDTGRGPQPVPLRRIAGAAAFDSPPQPVTGDVRVRHLGWTRSATTPLWRIEQDVPLPFTLLTATTELKVND
ncbi:MAG: hypothetical protein GVY28_12925 [Alphaproteobacteria bacterium]|jgi:hypothetical protein|nr:hypothetical protein [Alphaproteobacteria bacterium]